MSASLKQYTPPKTAKSDFWRELGVPARGVKLHLALEQGFSFDIYKKLAKNAGIEQKQLAQYTAIKPATLQRRAGAGRFNSEESDKLYRFAEVLKAANDLFEGDAEGAKRWMHKPARGLGDLMPIEMISSSAGSEAVLDLIGRLEHGVLV